MVSELPVPGAAPEFMQSQNRSRLRNSLPSLPLFRQQTCISDAAPAEHKTCFFSSFLVCSAFNRLLCRIPTRYVPSPQLASEEEKQTPRAPGKVFLGQQEKGAVQKPGAGSLDRSWRWLLRGGERTPFRVLSVR